MSSAGFWLGTGLGKAAFYAYTYAEPDGYRTAETKPEAVYYHDELREYILPYEAVRSSADPDETLLSFLNTTYKVAAISGKWDEVVF